MKFPKACDIATQQVVAVDINTTILEAIEKMIANEHRDIIITHNKDYYVLRALDVIDFYNANIDLTQPLKTLPLIKLPTVHKETNILQMLHLLDAPTEYICSVNHDNTLHGIITHTDITSHIDPETLMDNYKVDDFLRLIRTVKWVKKSHPTKTILQEMIEESLDSVIVVEELKPLGILTTKDVIRLIKEKKDLNLPICEYMTSPIETLHKDTSIREALNFLKTKHYKRVVVVDNNNILLGVVTQKELITLTYVNWSSILKEHQAELSEINTMLQNQNKKYKSLASKDPLTNLYNRYKFEQLYYITRDATLAREGQLALLLIDIDHFKKINDTHGHNVGDDVLQHLAKVLLASTRTSDIVGRWGGEEFVILLNNVNKDIALLIAQKLRTQIEKEMFEHIHHITASIGVVQISEKYKLEESVELADKALYEAKKQGRNRVVMYECTT